MARSLNRAELIGHVGNDPELRSTQNGNRCATFSFATSRDWKDSNGEKHEKTEWHRCVAWNLGNKGGLADVIEKYVKKGDKLYVDGRIEYRQWTDKENVTRYSTEINVSQLLMLGGNAETPEKKGESHAPAPDELEEETSLPF